MNRRGFLSMTGCGFLSGFSMKNNILSSVITGRDVVGEDGDDMPYSYQVLNQDENVRELRISWKMNMINETPSVDVQIPLEQYYDMKGGMRRYESMFNSACTSQFVAELYQKIQHSSSEQISYIQDRMILEGITNVGSSSVYQSARFVQSAIEGMLDEDIRGLVEYIQHPVETVFLGYGDCDDSTMLLCGLLAEAGVRSGFLIFPFHIGTIAVKNDLPYSEEWNTFITVDGIEYVYIETTEYYNEDKDEVLNTPDELRPSDSLCIYTEENGYQFFK